MDLPPLSPPGDIFPSFGACALCRGSLTSEHERDLNEARPHNQICDGCGLIFEGMGSHTTTSSHRGRTSRHGSSESIEDLFSHQFSQILNRARQSESLTPEYEDLDASLRSMRTSSLTTPSSSRRWRRFMSDSESDIFDYPDSLFGGSESYLSFSGRRLFHGDSDGGDSDMSVDRRSFFDNDIFAPPSDFSSVDSDTDIDPMHVGDVHWNSDDEEDPEGNNQREQNYSAENMLPLREASDRVGVGAPRVVVNHSVRVTEDFERIHWRRQESGDIQILPNIFADLDEPGGESYLREHDDYLDPSGFEQLLDHLATTDRSRRGAPPAALSAVNSLPQILIRLDHVKPDGLACAICKDILTVGNEATQMPCNHLYHLSCILRWLNSRNSCPLCRYELPTDDMDYEEGKNNNANLNRRLGIHEIRQQDSGDDSSSASSEVTDATEWGEVQVEELGDRDDPSNVHHRNNDRGRWFLLAAAPIISIMGVAFMLWLDNQPVAGGRASLNAQNIHPQGSASGFNIQSSCQPSQQGNRRKGWWWF